MKGSTIRCLLLVGMLLVACGSPRPRATSTIPFLRPAETLQAETPDPSVAGTPADGLPSPPPQGTESIKTPEAFTPTASTPIPTLRLPILRTSTPIVVITQTVPTEQSDIPLLPSATPTTTQVVTATAVERLPEPVQPPPAQLASTVSIWHSWDEAELQALWNVIGSFQQTYPNVGFDLVYVPPDDLKAKFTSESYKGSGPSLLLAPAEWGPELGKSELVTDLASYVNPDFLATLNAAGLESGRYQGKLISLPHALRGLLMYRNQSILPESASTFDELVVQCQSVSKIGAVGAVIDRGIYYSGGHLAGLNGMLMDADGNPAFNSAAGVEWIGLLKSLAQLGVTTFNTNRDRTLFEQGQAGIIIETSNAMHALEQAIGSENLAIDPWPSYGTGSLSGYVLADSIYLNANLDGDDLASALAFTGYFLAPEVQSLMAEVGHIPSGLNVTVRDRLIGQAMAAFAGGTAFPMNPEAQVYWNVLESALLDTFNRGVDPTVALAQAYDVITARLAEMRR